MPTYAVNKQAHFDYEILETYEAGIVLEGQEVKSIKTGHINLKSTFVTLRRHENREVPDLYLINCHIPRYRHAIPSAAYEPTRSRKLLLKKSEIRKLIGKQHEKGLTFVPLKVYNKGSLIKVAFALAKGKKKFDKRETIKKREVDRTIRRLQKYS